MAGLGDDSLHRPLDDSWSGIAHQFAHARRGEEHLIFGAAPVASMGNFGIWCQRFKRPIVLYYDSRSVHAESISSHQNVSHDDRGFEYPLLHNVLRALETRTRGRRI